MGVGAARAPGATRSAPRWRPALAGLLAGLLLVTSSALADPPAVLAVHEGTPDLTLVTVSRYEVQPANRRVRVTVTITATNHLSDTATRRFYFERAFLAVLPGTSGFKITGSSGTPKVSISAAKPDHTLLRIDFGARLAAGKSTSLTLTFDLKDPGGAGNRDVRIGSTIVSFPVWAYGTDATPGSRVSVALPADYVVDFAVGGLAGPELDASGLAVYDSGVLDAPLDFYVYLVGDRPGAYVDRDLSIPVNGSMATLVVQSWEDDPEWGDWVSDLLERGLPALGLAIGLEWPLEDSIVVREALARSTGGYAGLFDPAEGRIDIAYYARPAVALHEAAHGWFNGALLADRWANEAFASLYGSAVGTELEVAVDDPELTVDLEAYRIPLNEWGAIGAVDSDVERYGYAASLALARLIAERAGDGVLREVWARASARVGAYQPVGGDALAPAIEGNESVAGPPDWRGLLDLLEDTAGRSFEDLWATWVIRDTDRPLLQDRASSRAAYQGLVVEAADWRLPPSIREALRVWQFDTADTLLAQASDVLVGRADIEREAATLGLTPPSTLRPLFERGDGFSDALSEVAGELAAIDSLGRAMDVRIAEPGPIEALGLLGTEPERDLAAARTAFEAGDLEGASSGAATALLAWTTAAEVGGGRAMSIGLLAAAALLLAFVVLRRGRDRPRGSTRTPMARHIGTRDGIAGISGTYATLADHPAESSSGEAQGDELP